MEVQTKRPKDRSMETRNKFKIYGTLICNRCSTINPRGYDGVF